MKSCKEDNKSNISTIAVQPGETIKDLLEDKGMSRDEFASLTGLSEGFADRLIEGKESLTHDIAVKLEDVLGVPAEFWDRLEFNYRTKLGSELLNGVNLVLKGGRL